MIGGVGARFGRNVSSFRNRNAREVRPDMEDRIWSSFLVDALGYRALLSIRLLLKGGSCGDRNLLAFQEVTL